MVDFRRTGRGDVRGLKTAISSNALMKMTGRLNQFYIRLKTHTKSTQPIHPAGLSHILPTSPTTLSTYQLQQTYSISSLEARHTVLSKSTLTHRSRARGEVVVRMISS